MTFILLQNIKYFEETTLDPINKTKKNSSKLDQNNKLFSALTLTDKAISTILLLVAERIN